MRRFATSSRTLLADALQVTVQYLPCIIAMLLLVLLASLTANAQSDWQLYGGTSFLWARTTPQQQNGLSTIYEWGWQSDITNYPWHWFGGTLEASGFYGRPNVYDPTNDKTYSDLMNTKSYTLMFGPSFVYNHNKYIQPFGHVLLGGVNGQYALTSKGALYLGGNTQNHGEWVFGWALGGGADVRINDLLAIRGQVDWLPTTFYNFYNDRESNLRVSVGLVFRFGGAATTTGAVHQPEPMPSDNSPSAMKSPPSPVAAEHSIAEQSAPMVHSAAPNTPALVMAGTSAPASLLKPQAPAVAPSASDADLQLAHATPPAPTIANQHNADTANTIQPGGAVAAPAPAPVVPASAMVEFWSNPSGADVEVDGEYVGSTFSTISLPPGEHIITVRKENFAPWQRTIYVTSGNVRVAAYLEQVKAIVTFH